MSPQMRRMKSCKKRRELWWQTLRKGNKLTTILSFQHASNVEFLHLNLLHLQLIQNLHSVWFLCRAKKGGFGGMFGMLKGLVGSKNLTQEDMEPVLDKMRDHLIGMTSLLPHGTSFKTLFVYILFTKLLQSLVMENLEKIVIWCFLGLENSWKLNSTIYGVYILCSKIFNQLIRGVEECQDKNKKVIFL